MKVIFITPKLNFVSAGGSVFDIDLKARALMELGAEIRFVTVFSENNKMPDPLPYPLTEERATGRGQLGILLDIFKILKKYEKEADFFHIDGHIFLYGAGLYKRLGGKIPIVAFFNRELIIFPQDVPQYDFGQPDEPTKKSFVKNLWWLFRSFIEKNFGMWLANKIEISTFTSPVIQKTYNDFGLHTAHQLINPDLAGGVIQAQKEPRKLAEFKKRPIRLLAAGRLLPTKGFDMVLKAFQSVQNDGVYTLTIAGGGPDEARLKRLAREWNVEDRVTFTGWLTHDKLFPLFESSDVFIMPRWRKELTSVILMEAMSYGLPSLIPDGGGVEWQAGDGALAFTYDDPANLGRKIALIAERPEILHDISIKALQRLDFLHYRNWIPPLYETMKKVLHEKH